MNAINTNSHTGEYPPTLPSLGPEYDCSQDLVSGVCYNIATNRLTGQQFVITRQKDRRCFWDPIVPGHRLFGRIYTSPETKKLQCLYADMLARLRLVR